MFTSKPLEFWAAILVAIIVKIKTSKQLGPLAVISTIFVSLGAAYSFATPLSSWLGVNEVLIAALVALTSEGVMRWLIQLSNDPSELKTLLSLWRGGSGK